MKKKRYNSINSLLKQKFGCRVYKVTLESGLGCPNKDGRISYKGCTFCDMNAYYAATDPLSEKPTKEALIAGINYVKDRHNTDKFIAYFQSGANTAGKLENLRKMFYEAIDHKDIVGLSISTRSDCLDDKKIALLEELSRKTYLWIELGLQSSNEETLKALNRNHSVKQFDDITKKLLDKKISVCAHVILGLPQEGKKEILDTANYLNNIKITGVKIHNLHILTNTLLEDMYKQGKLKPLTLLEYAILTTDFLEHLDPKIIIHRLNGHAPKKFTVAPKWSINKLEIFNAVEKELEKRDTWQGKKFTGVQ